jgi:hypothetical protein
MSGILRRCLVIVLSAGLIAAGLPLAHAMPCATVSQPPASAHQHHDMAADMASHVHDGARVATPSQRHVHHDKVAFDICKCLNCGMCATPGVQPSVRGAIPERFGHRFLHASAEEICPAAVVGVDPGIPILVA